MGLGGRGIEEDSKDAFAKGLSLGRFWVRGWYLTADIHSL